MSDITPLESLDAPQRRDCRYVAMALAIAIFSALSLVCAMTSQGFVEADACTHYLYARFAFAEPHYLVNLWGRPLVTAIYAVPAVLGGRFAVRVETLLLALLIAWAAYRVAILQGYKYPVLALIFTLAQPLVFLHSFGELTELPFAALIILAFWAYRLRRWWLVAMLIGIAPLGRPEGFGFIALAAFALACHRQWKWLPLLVVPLIIWNHAGWVLFGGEGAWWRWLPSQWPYAKDSVYSRGPWLYFVGLLPVIASPVVFPAMLVGIVRSLRFQIKAFFDDDRTRAQALIAGLPLMILLGHSVLYALGKMASNGEPRYMLVVAPFWGLLSALGWEFVFTRLQWRGVLRWAGVAALLPALSNQFVYKVLPLTPAEDWRHAQAIADWYRSDPALQEKFPRIMAAHPGIYFYLDRSFSNTKFIVPWLKDELAKTPPGTLLIWDRIYGVYNADTARSIHDTDILAAGWVEVHPKITGLSQLSEEERATLNRHEHGASLDLTSTQPHDQALDGAMAGMWRVFVSPADADSLPPALK